MSSVACMNSTARVALLGMNFPPEHTGIAPYAGALARGLARRGAHVHAHTAHPHYPQWRLADGYGQWTRREEQDGIRLTRYRHFVPRSPKGVARLWSEMTLGFRLATARLGRPDVIVAISPALFASAIAIAVQRLRLQRVPVVVWVQDLYSVGIAETEQGGGLAERVVRAVESRLLRSAARVVVIHERFASTAINALGVSPERVSVVRNWTHLPPSPETDTAATRALLGWEAGETIVLHSGNMGVKQGLENVIAAAREADSRGVPVRFVLAGDGGERISLTAAAVGVRRIDFVAPFSDELYQAALAAADVLLVNEKPGVSEMAVPSKLTSYFSAGRPVLAATDAAGTTAGEISASGGGEIVAAGDPKALLEAVLALRADQGRANALGAAGRRYRESVLSEEIALDNYAGVLARVVAEGRLSGRS